MFRSMFYGVISAAPLTADLDTRPENVSQQANRGWAICHAVRNNTIRERLMGAFTQFVPLFVMIVFLFLAISMKSAFALTISEFAIPTASSTPQAIAAGPDGNLWFTEYGGVKIGKITPAGVFTEYGPLSGQPDGITSGPDGNLWFADSGGNKIGKITPAGVITEFALPTAFSSPGSIAVGPDGNLWFTEGNANKIGRITTAGAITEYADPTAASLPVGITAGPDGNLWFTELNTGKIGRITTAGVITEFATPSPSGWPRGITSGPDGNLWYAVDQGNKIGKITTAGVVTEYALPTGTPYTNSNQPNSIIVGPDGNLWFTEGNGNKIGMITTAGVITEYAVPTAASWPMGIATGSDGRIWFLENSGNKVGAVGPVSTTGVSSSITPSTTGQSVTFTVTVAGGTPTGAVQFKDGTTNLGSPVTLSGGSATYSTSALSAGSHSITAVYGGDLNIVGSTSTVVTQTVNAASAPLLYTVGVSGIGATAATLTATSDATATGYWIVVPQGSTAPTVAQVKAGVGYASVTLAASGGGAMTAGTPRNFSVSGLTAATVYDLYVVAEDSSNHLISAATQLQFSTTAAPVNGTCVTGQTLTIAPTNPNLCTAGTASSVTSGTTSYTWSCLGSNGGSDATTCSAVRNYVVTTSVNGGNGTISASQNMAYNANAYLTLTPNAGYIAGPVTGTCGGTPGGSVYTTNGVTASCTVVASFTAALPVVTTFTGPTATGTGSATATVSAGGANCGFTTAQFVSAPTPLPGGVSFPHGLFDFILSGCGVDGSAKLTITYPSTLPSGTQYWKFGPTTGNTAPHWYTIPVSIAGNTATFTLYDGGLGDDDLLMNGIIVDQGGPGGLGGGGVASIPTLSEWGMIILSSLLALGTLVTLRRQRL